MTAPKNIDEAMHAFQADPPVLVKDKSAHQSRYADLVQAHNVILPKLNALGVTWATTTRFLDDGKFVLEYVLKHIASGTTRYGVWPLRLVDNPQQMGSQVTYARRYALTVATGVAAEDEDDDGGAASGRQYAQRAAQQGRRQQPARPAEGRTTQRAQRPRGDQPPLPDEEPNGKVGADQHRHMRALWSDLNAGGDERRDFRLRKMAEWLGLESLNSSADLTREQADQVITQLRATKKQRQAAAEVPGGAE